MKPRDTHLRSKQFQLDEARRRLAQIEYMIADLMRMAGELDQQIAVEEQKSGVNDPSHFAYPTFARAARQRRDNLMVSVHGLEAQRDQAASVLADVEAEHAALMLKAERMDATALHTHARPHHDSRPSHRAA